MSAKNTFELTYTWPDSGKLVVRYRAVKGSETAKDLRAKLDNLWKNAGGRTRSPYDFRYTDYKL